MDEEKKVLRAKRTDLYGCKKRLETSLTERLRSIRVRIAEAKEGNSEVMTTLKKKKKKIADILLVSGDEGDRPRTRVKLDFMMSVSQIIV